jgi:hypothetical protein
MSNFNAVAFSDDALARAFAERHVGSLLSILLPGKWVWYVRKNGQWHRDHTLEVVDLARRHCAEASAGAFALGRERCALRVARASTIKAVLKLASADRLLVARLTRDAYHYAKDPIDASDLDIIPNIPALLRKKPTHSLG